MPEPTTVAVAPPASAANGKKPMATKVAFTQITLSMFPEAMITWMRETSEDKLLKENLLPILKELKKYALKPSKAGEQGECTRCEIEAKVAKDIAEAIVEIHAEINARVKEGNAGENEVFGTKHPVYKLPHPKGCGFPN